MSTYETKYYTKYLTHYTTAQPIVQTTVTMTFDANTDMQATTAQKLCMEKIISVKGRNILIYGTSRVGKSTIAELLARQGRGYCVKSSLSLLDVNEYTAITNFVRTTLTDTQHMIITRFDEFDYDVNESNIKQIRNILDTTHNTFGTYNLFTTNACLDIGTSTYNEWNEQYLIKRFDLIIKVCAIDEEISYKGKLKVTFHE